MRQRYVRLGSFLAPVVLIGCGGPQQVTPSANGGSDAPASQVAHVDVGNEAILANTLRGFNLSDPKSDLDANLARGDRRFIGLNGYTCTVPGVPEDAVELQRYGAGPYCLPGTSDVIGSARHLALTQTAEDYARRYNAELFRRMRAGAI